MVSHGVQGRARASTIALLWRLIALPPFLERDIHVRVVNSGEVHYGERQVPEEDPCDEDIA